MAYSLTLIEFSILLLTDTLLCGLGYLVFRQWSKRELVTPVWVVGIMLVGVFVTYGYVARSLLVNVEDGARFAGTSDTAQSGTKANPRMQVTKALAASGQLSTADAEAVAANRPIPGKQPIRVPALLLYALAFWTIPVGYYTWVLLGSIGAWWVDRRSWMEMEISDQFSVAEIESFDEAQRFALAGDLPSAIGGPSSFSKKRADGCFAAARLLEANGDYAQAAEILLEVSGHAAALERTWSEATYRVALIHEKFLANSGEAANFYLQVVTRFPNSEHGQMAAIALDRLRPQGDVLLETLNAGFDYNPEQDDTESQAV